MRLARGRTGTSSLAAGLRVFSLALAGFWVVFSFLVVFSLPEDKKGSSSKKAREDNKKSKVAKKTKKSNKDNLFPFPRVVLSCGGVL